MRKLATIRMVRDIQPIKDADNIEVLSIDGWKVVSKKGEHQIGDYVIYLEVDSWVPYSLAPFLSKGNEPKVFEGIPGERLRTVKLRGQISQGLVLPFSILNSEQNLAILDNRIELDEILGIKKWDPVIPATLSGNIKGLFPHFIPKTDQERIQNLTDEYSNWYLKDTLWEVTEKIDGSSMTVFVNDGDLGVCSRNYELSPDSSNTFWHVTTRDGLLEKISSTCRNLAFQGELIGPGIQGNKYKCTAPRFLVYDIFDIDSQLYLNPFERFAMCQDLGISHVPIPFISPLNKLISDDQDILKFSEGKSKLEDVEREGLVFKSESGQVSFKVISNKWLLKEK